MSINNQDLKEYMTFNKDGSTRIPLAVFEVNGTYIIGVYQGSLSKFDMLVKYRQKVNDKWSRMRTPKHIHWAVDMLIKLHEDPDKTKSFLDFLLSIWESTKPVVNQNQQHETLNIEHLLKDSQYAIQKYDILGTRGEYSVKFLILLAKLLMTQEKTNLETAYMFKKLLSALRKGDDIFSIVSVATQRRR